MAIILKECTSDGKIAYLIKPILMVLQEAGGKLERTEIKNRISDLDEQIAEFAEAVKLPSPPEIHIKNSTLNLILPLKIYLFLN